VALYHKLPAASNVSYDVAKRPHFYFRPSSCVVKYTGSQSLNPFLLCEIFLLQFFYLKSVLNVPCVFGVC